MGGNMSILIKGMEMPKDCSECQFSDVFAYPPDYDDEWICELTYLSMNWEDAQMRHSNCPLVELPTPHGRLIDADALLASENQHYEYRSDSFFVETRTIELAPTIIPADKDGE